MIRVVKILMIVVLVAGAFMTGLYIDGTGR